MVRHSIPIARYLVPEPAAQPPEGFARVDSRLSRGVPHAIDLTATERLLLVAPTGVATFWRTADPALVASASDPERAPRTDGSPLALPPLGRVPFRLLYQVNRRTLAVAPLVAGAVARLPETGGAGARIEIVVLDWRLHAGALRGAGDFGSFVSLAWRSAAVAVAQFSEPPPNPVFLKRQPPHRRLRSRVGVTRRFLFLEARIKAQAKTKVIIK